LISREFLENRRSKSNSVLHLQTQMNFCLYCPNVLPDLDVMLLRVY
jgi:hypothetical protein